MLICWYRLPSTCLIITLYCSFRPIPDVSGRSVAERVKEGIKPFLRCAALFFNCLTGVQPPEELSSAAGESHRSTVQTHHNDVTMNELLRSASCSYLSRTVGGAVQLLGVALQFVPALPRAQRRRYCPAAEVDDKHQGFLFLS